MPNRVGWAEQEVRAAVSAYFKLLRAEQDGVHTNKAKLYRDLSTRFPKRVPKAWELKFQNISAILYHQHLPYCSGLKPRFRYQRLLKLLVLDELERSPLPAIEPHEILFAKLLELSARGPIPVAKRGAGRFGLAIEEVLGIQQNSSKEADFMGIELKTKIDGSLQTLFSRTPSRFVQDPDKRTMFERHSYVDQRNRRALYTSFSAKRDSLGFHLAVADQVVRVLRETVTILEYDAERIEEALLSKHSQTAFLTLDCGRDDRGEVCTLKGAQYCKWPSILRFLQLVQSGHVFLDFTMSEDVQGKVKDHGFLWRIRTEALPELYLSIKAFDSKSRAWS
jgi:MvaI/BcnI restriction endonuclease family